MATFERFTASLDAAALLHGEMLFRSVALDSVELELERNPDGVGNWSSGTPHTKPPPPQGDPVDAGRANFPTVLDLVVRHGKVILHTTAGHVLTIAAESLTLHTTGREAPVRLDADGSYNAVPVKLGADMQSLEVLKDPATPYGVEMTATGANTVLTLKGTMTDPLNFDGVHGRLDGRVARLSDLGPLLGSDFRADLPLALGGTLLRQGDHWQLDDASGQLADNAFSGTLALDEGGHTTPDRIGTTLHFVSLDADAVQKQVGGTGGGPPAPFEVDTHPDPQIDARMAIDALAYSGLAAKQVAFHASVVPGRIAAEDVSMLLFDGKLQGSAVAVPSGPASGAAPRIDAWAAAAGVDARAAMRFAGVTEAILAGKLDARAAASGTGATQAALTAGTSGQMVVAMRQGQISRSVVQLASVDLRTLFRKSPGFSSMTCLLAVVDMTGGVAQVTPVRVRTGEGTLFGGGVVDLLRQTMNLTIKTEGRSTGFFALDLPINITGRIDNPSIAPQINSAAQAIMAQGTGTIRRLPPEMQSMANGNPCVR